MKAIELFGDIDDGHRLHADVPQDLPTGPVRLIVFLPDEDRSPNSSAHCLVREWTGELEDPRQDLYTLEDGQPVNTA